MCQRMSNDGRKVKAAKSPQANARCIAIGSRNPCDKQHTVAIKPKYRNARCTLQRAPHKGISRVTPVPLLSLGHFIRLPGWMSSSNNRPHHKWLKPKDWNDVIAAHRAHILAASWCGGLVVLRLCCYLGASDAKFCLVMERMTRLTVKVNGECAENCSVNMQRNVDFHN